MAITKTMATMADTIYLFILCAPAGVEWPFAGPDADKFARELYKSVAHGQAWRALRT